jgi:hypothetical protein
MTATPKKKIDPFHADPLRMNLLELLMEWDSAVGGPVQRTKPNEVTAASPSGGESCDLVAYLIIEDAMDAWTKSTPERAWLKRVLRQLAREEYGLLDSIHARDWDRVFDGHGAVVARAIRAFAKKVIEEQQKRMAVPEAV